MARFPPWGLFIPGEIESTCATAEQIGHRRPRQTHTTANPPAVVTPIVFSSAFLSPSGNWTCLGVHAVTSASQNHSWPLITHGGKGQDKPELTLWQVKGQEIPITGL